MLSQDFFPYTQKQTAVSYEQLDVTIVFGEGPIKPLLLEEELTSEQQAHWDVYKTAPLTNEEPDFFVIERDMPSDVFDHANKAYWDRLQTVRYNPELSDTEKTTELGQMLLRWQHWGRFSLKRMGKQNAIAAGIALLSGMTKEIIITGGHTLPEWKNEEFVHLFHMQHPHITVANQAEHQQRYNQFLKYFIRWPSEAELMADMIVHNFNEAYLEKTGLPIMSVIHLETEARNTIENITLTINKFPEVGSPQKRVGLLSSNHHLERIALIADRFHVATSPSAQISAQKLLGGVAAKKEKEAMQRLFAYYMSEINPWVAKHIDTEKHLISGLTTPEYLTYWFGYTFEVEDPRIIMDVLKQYKDPAWKQAMERAFATVGLDFLHFTTLDLEKLADTDPEAYSQLKRKMKELTNADHRAMPFPQVQ